MKKQDADILVIEDHDATRLLLGVMIGKRHKVTTKKDGIEGLAWLGNGHIPDLIILDIDMPRMNGIEFIHGIRTSGVFGKIPVIILTGNEEPDTWEACYALQVNLILQKPFNPVYLLEKIEEYVLYSPVASI